LLKAIPYLKGKKRITIQLAQCLSINIQLSVIGNGLAKIWCLISQKILWTSSKRAATFFFLLAFKIAKKVKVPTYIYCLAHLALFSWLLEVVAESNHFLAASLYICIPVVFIYRRETFYFAFSRVYIIFLIKSTPKVRVFVVLESTHFCCMYNWKCSLCIYSVLPATSCMRVFDREVGVFQVMMPIFPQLNHHWENRAKKSIFSNFWFFNYR